MSEYIHYITYEIRIYNCQWQIVKYLNIFQGEAHQDFSRAEGGANLQANLYESFHPEAKTLTWRILQTLEGGRNLAHKVMVT